jgi:hypothetical protein
MLIHILTMFVRRIMSYCRYARFVLANFTAYRKPLQQEQLLSRYQAWRTSVGRVETAMQRMVRNMNDYSQAVETSRVIAKARRAEIKDALAAHAGALMSDSDSDRDNDSDDSGVLVNEREYDVIHDCGLPEESVDAFLSRLMDVSKSDPYTNGALDTTKEITWEYAR